MQLVLWQPPAPIIEEKVKGEDSPVAASSPKAEYSRHFLSGETSMECAMESPQLSIARAPSTTTTGNGNFNVSPASASTGWGTNVQLFDSVDDDDMDL